MIEEAQNQVQQFLETCRAEREQIAKEVKEIDILIQQSTAEVDRLVHKNAELESRVRQMENNFDTVPRSDIQSIYNETRREQGRLFMMRGQSETLQTNRKGLDRYGKLLDQIVEVFGQSDPWTARSARAEPGTTPGQSMVVRVIEAQETEKLRLARLMHDGPAQRLTNVILQAEICQRLLGTDPARAREELENLKGAVNKTFQLTRTFIADLRPMMLDDLGLVPTLRRYMRIWSEETGIEAEFTATGGDQRLPSYAEVTIFRVVQEALENAGKHANPSRVQVSLRLDGRTVRVLVEDDGRGFDVQEVLESADEHRTIGLALIQDRAQMLGGMLDIDSAVGRGTRLRLEIPQIEQVA